jgi:hypothetical protein
MLEKFIQRSKEVSEREKKLLEDVKKINKVKMLKKLIEKEEKDQLSLKQIMKMNFDELEIESQEENATTDR